MIEVGTPEYYAALKKINEIARPLYQQLGLPPPEDIIGDETTVPTKKLSFADKVSRFFSGPEPTAPPGYDPSKVRLKGQ